MDWLHRTPFFRLIVPMIAGIVAFQYFIWSEWLLFSLAGLGVLLMFISFVTSKIYSLRWLFGSGLMLLIFATGYFVPQQFEIRNIFQHRGEKGLFYVEIAENPVVREKSVLCRVKTLAFGKNGKFTETSGNAILYVQKTPQSVALQSGERMLVRTTFGNPDGQINPDGFDYCTYLARQGFGATAYAPTGEWKKADEDTGFSLTRMAGKMQAKLLQVYKNFNISGDEYAVLAALTLGSKDALHPELRQNYTTSGGMHILAVSGLHVGVIYMVLGFLLSFLDRKSYLKIIKTVLIILLLWMYAFITGLPPSVIRSTIMFSMVALGTGLSRKSLIYNTIFASAFLMLFYNPNFIFDVSFELSYMAVLAIVYFQPKISRWFVPKNKILKWAWDLTAVSLAAQLGTAPLGLFYFHQFSNYFLLTNLIAIPFATFIIYNAVALFVFSAVPYISVILAFLLKGQLIVLNTGIKWIHDLPGSLSVFSINSVQIFLFFTALLLLVVFLNTKKFMALSGSLIAVIAFLTIIFYRNYQTFTRSQIIVYADNANTNVDFMDGKNHFLYTTGYDAAERVAKNYWVNHGLNEPVGIRNNIGGSTGFISFHGLKIAILTDNTFNGKTAFEKLNIDYLIIGNKLKPKIRQVLECVSPGEIIVDKTISGWYAGDIEKVCRDRNIRFYSVARKGARIIGLTD